MSPTASIEQNAAAKEAAPVHQGNVLPSNSRRYFLLFVFAMSQFMDIYCASAVVVALPPIAADLGMTLSESIWLVNAYTLTLAAFLLTGGRLADIWSAKWVFVLGFTWLGIFSLIIGFIRNKAVIFFLRAMAGIGASLTIPSAMSLIVSMFPDPAEQATAIAIFGGSGAVANVVGLIFGGALLLKKWTWIFFFTAILVLPLAGVAALLIPPLDNQANVVRDKSGVIVDRRKPKMDYPGTILLTAAIVLLIFGLTQGGVKGWKSAETLAPLIIGFFLFPAFFYWETKVDSHDALIMSDTWSIPNFILLTGLSLVPNAWFYMVQVPLTAIFQENWGKSPINVSLRFIVSGMTATLMIVFCGALPLKYLALRKRFVIGGIIGVVGSLLLTFVDGPDTFWKFAFTGLFFGSAGTAMIFISANVAIVMAVDPKHAGVAGGVFNSTIQLGVALGLAVTSGIQSAFVEPGHKTASHKGYQASFFFTMAVHATVILVALIGYRDPPLPVENAAANDETRTGTPNERGNSQEKTSQPA